MAAWNGRPMSMHWPKPAYSIFFDAAATEQRVAVLTRRLPQANILQRKTGSADGCRGLALCTRQGRAG
jgi:hypothetical protein